MENYKKTKGPVAKVIEEQTAKLPFDLFLWAALGAIGASLTLKLWVKGIAPYLWASGQHHSFY